jgi:hypothetical protein
MFNQKTQSAFIASVVALSISTVAARTISNSAEQQLDVESVPTLSLSMAQAATITLNGQENIAFTVTNLVNVAGFGAHFSTTAYTNGYGGANVECHLLSGSVVNPGSTVQALCYDGYLDPTHHVNEYRLDLGAKKRSDDGRDTLSSVTFIVSEEGVKVEAERIASNPYTNESYPYKIEATFPLRQSTGFWSTGQIHYIENGVLDGSREGINYVLNVAENVPDGDGQCNHYPSPTYRFDSGNNTGVLTLPTVDIEMINPLIPNTWLTLYDAYSVVMELMPTSGYFYLTEVTANQPATDDAASTQPATQVTEAQNKQEAKEKQPATDDATSTQQATKVK